MRITITAPGGSPEALCDHGRESPSGLTPQALRSVEVLSFVQALFAKPKNRGNMLNQLTFSVSKEHTSHTAAQIYLFRLNETVPTVGTLDIELEDQRTHIEAFNATLEFAPMPIIGVMTTVTYTIKYGAINAIFEAVPSLTSDGKQRIDANGKKIFVRKEIL
jgi:hypothetical protein